MLLLLSAAFAQDPVDIGVIQNQDIRVVQRVLFPKDDRLELSAQLGVLPFDSATVAPLLALGGTYHLSEMVAAEVRLAGGYGFKTADYTLAESTVGVAWEAYRYLGGIEADVQYTPIYAKLNLGGRRILHHDVYGLAGLGATIEQSVFPSAEVSVAPTLPLGIGTRVWFSNKLALRAEVRDSLLLQYRAQSQGWYFKQNVAVTAGLAFYLGGPS